MINVYENTSDELLDLFENFCDLFRNARFCSEWQFSCSPSSNIYARLIHQRYKQTIISARFGGQTEATKRLLSQLPISAQSYSSSPYLDLQLFSYDDKWVSLMERPKTSGEHPIRCVKINNRIPFVSNCIQPNVSFCVDSMCEIQVYCGSEYTPESWVVHHHRPPLGVS